MKTIGLIGGMSWESTVTYYEIINRTIKEKLGGLHSGKLVLFSVDFQEIEECQAKGEWDKSAKILTEAAQSLEKAGADFIVICTNTMHKIAPDIQRNINIPIFHIAEATADELDKKDIKKVALLGTKYTMEQDFYKNKLIDRGIEVVIPDDEDRAEVNRVIYEELCLGKILPLSKKKFLEIMDKLLEKGAQGVILGCTEIGLLVQQKDTDISLFDTAEIHAKSVALKSIEK